MDLSNARWRKSSYSGSASDCVEVAFVGEGVATRDSKDPNGPALVFTRAEWATFLTALRTDHLDT